MKPISRANRYVYQSAAIDISAGAATLDDLVFIPRAGTLLRAAFVAVEAFGATMNTGAIQVGYANADGGGDDEDAYVLGTTDQANGLLDASEAVGTCQELTLATTVLTAGKMITITHIQDVGETGEVRIILEYELG